MNNADMHSNIKRYIDDLYANACIRPKMFFPSPEAFESCVMVLEDIYYIDIINNVDNLRLSNKYINYLISEGYSSSSFISRCIIDKIEYNFNKKIDINVDELFILFVEFLRSYLVNAGRLKESE